MVIVHGQKTGVAVPTPHRHNNDVMARSTFWTTLPGILTGAAALITAIVGAVTLLSPRSEPARPSQTDQRPSQTDQTKPSQIERRTFVLKPGDWLDVNTGITGSAVADGTLVWSGTQLNLYGLRNAVVDQPAGKAGCDAALQRRSDGYLVREQLARGLVVCQSTKQGLVAQLDIQAPAPDNRLSLAVTVWR